MNQPLNAATINPQIVIEDPKLAAQVFALQPEGASRDPHDIFYRTAVAFWEAFARPDATLEQITLWSYALVAGLEAARHNNRAPNTGGPVQALMTVAAHAKSSIPRAFMVESPEFFNCISVDQSPAAISFAVNILKDWKGAPDAPTTETVAKILGRAIPLCMGDVGGRVINQIAEQANDETFAVLMGKLDTINSPPKITTISAYNNVAAFIESVNKGLSEKKSRLLFSTKSLVSAIFSATDMAWTTDKLQIIKDLVSARPAYDQMIALLSFSHTHSISERQKPLFDEIFDRAYRKMGREKMVGAEIPHTAIEEISRLAVDGMWELVTFPNKYYINLADNPNNVTAVNRVFEALFTVVDPLSVWDIIQNRKSDKGIVIQPHRTRAEVAQAFRRKARLVTSLQEGTSVLARIKRFMRGINVPRFS